MITLLKNSDYQEALWKNGLGKTLQIAIFPPEANVSQNNFIWRISSATVTADCPFSHFSDYERLLVIWKGNGLKLNDNILLPNAPISFSGDDDIQCDLLGTLPVVDLGIIYDKKKVHAKLSVLKLIPGESINPGTGLHFLFLASDHNCIINDIQLGAGETLKIENEISIHQSGDNQQDTTLFHIALRMI